MNRALLAAVAALALLAGCGAPAAHPDEPHAAPATADLPPPRIAAAARPPTTAAVSPCAAALANAIEVSHDELARQGFDDARIREMLEISKAQSPRNILGLSKRSVGRLFAARSSTI